MRHNEYQKEKQVVEDKIKSVQEDIINKTKTLHKKVPLDDINVLELELLNLETQVNTISSRLESDETIADANKEKIKKANKILSSYNIDDVNERYTIYNDTKRNISTLESKRERLKLQVKHKLEKLATNSEFDPNCEFCIKRESEYIEMSKAVKLELVHDKGHVAEVLSELKVYNEYITNNDNIINDYNKIQQVNNLLSGIERERSAGRISYYQAKEKRDVFQQKANDIKTKIKKYHSNIKAIEENKEINSVIDTLTNRENTLKHELNTVNSKCQLCYSDIKVCKTNIRNINSHIKKAHELEVRLKAYEYYLDAIKRDGIPYEIISDTLPYIQEEVNNILSQVVDFELVFDVDGKNILTYIKYGDNSWSLDMTSGMEKFISSLAIRVALINVSNLPRPTFLAIDEGFGNLDTNNINSISMLFDYLKTEFDFILIISHIDIMKDMVDDIIEISKQNNLSNVIY